MVNAADATKKPTNQAKLLKCEMTDAAGDSDAKKKIKTGFTCAAGYSAATDLSGCVDCSKGGTLGVSAAFDSCT